MPTALQVDEIVRNGSGSVTVVSVPHDACVHSRAHESGDEVVGNVKVS